MCARLQVRSLDDYLLAGRRSGTWLTAGTLAATVIGAGSTIGAAGVAFYAGLSAGWYLLSASIGLLVLGLTLAPALRRLSLYTVPAFVELRYGPRAGLLASVLGVASLVLFLSAQFYAMGALVAELTGVALGRAILVSSLVVVLYTWRGGNWALHLSDNVQLLWIFAGVALAAAWGCAWPAGSKGSLLHPPRTASRPWARRGSIP